MVSVWCFILGCTCDYVAHDRKHFGNVDKIITIKDGKAFQGEEPSTMEITV